ncbi:MAG: hypothetical protein WC716_05550 [Chitinophagaceae bacterium]|jgi:hypothetical protein
MKKSIAKGVNILGCLMMIFITSQPCFATCIVIMKQSDGIFIGADSRRNIYDHQMKQSIVDDYCKIHYAGNIYIAVAGYSDEQMKNIALSAAQKSSSASEALNKCKIAIEKKLSETTETYRIKNKKGFEQRFAQSLVGSVSFFSFINGKPELLTIHFSLVSSKSNKCIVKGDIDYSPIVFLGVSDHILKVPEQNVAKFISDRDWPKMVKTLIELEAKEHPQWVGGPIDMLQLDAKGAHWVQKKGNCQG